MAANVHVYTVFFGVVFLLSFVNGNGKYAKEQNESNERSLDDRPFRMSKINLMWEKAKKTIPQAELSTLHREFTIQDKMELEWKKKSAEGLDPTGEQEAALRKRFHGTLVQFGLYKDTGSNLRVDNEIFEPQLLNEDTLHFDSKLSKLWTQALRSGFPDDELNELKTEFMHHQDKLDELDKMKLDLYAMEDMSPNSIHRFNEEGKDMKKIKDDGHKQLKRKFNDLKEEYLHLEAIVSKDKDLQGLPFKNRKVLALWNQAKKANFSETELQSFKQELTHFENKLLKHEYKRKESEMMDVHTENNPGKTNSAASPSEIHGDLSDSDKKLKKYHAELKRKIAQKLRTEL